MTVFWWWKSYWRIWCLRSFPTQCNHWRNRFDKVWPVLILVPRSHLYRLSPLSSLPVCSRMRKYFDGKGIFNIFSFLHDQILRVCGWTDLHKGYRSTKFGRSSSSPHWQVAWASTKESIHTTLFCACRSAANTFERSGALETASLSLERCGCIVYDRRHGDVERGFDWRLIWRDFGPRSPGQIRSGYLSIDQHKY